MLSPALLDPIIDRALTEDLAGGDLTSDLTVDAETRARAVAIARTPLVVCGGFVFARVFERVDPSVRVVLHEAEGARVKADASSGRCRARRGRSCRPRGRRSTSCSA